MAKSDFTIAEAKAHLNKAMSAQIIGSLEGMAIDHPAWSTGSFLIDTITGIGGLPKGRIIELYGEFSSGKSTVLASTAAATQRAGMPVLYADYEHACDRKYLKAQGVDLSDDMFVYSQPNTMEEGLQVISFYVVRGLVGLVIVDSLAAMETAAELKEDIGGVGPIAIQARVMAQALKRLVKQCSDSETTVALINQVRTAIPTPWEAMRRIKRETTPGGSALKFYASMRIKFVKISGVKGKIMNPISGQMEDGIVATKVRAECVKNKMAPPFRQCEFVIRYGMGIDNVMSAVNVAIARDMIHKTDAILRVPAQYHHTGEDKNVRGLENLCNYFRNEGAEGYALLEHDIQSFIQRDVAISAQDAVIEEDDIVEIAEGEQDGTGTGHKAQL